MITITDIRAAGHCVRGFTDWCDTHGLDWREILRDGIDEQVFLDTGDAMAQQVVDHKRMNGG